MLRDINFSAALVIPETDDGVEIQLQLQENLKSTAMSACYSFAVESTANDRWTLHCEGSITACQSFRLVDRSSPVDVSKLTQRVSSKKWYDAFHRVGFQYQGSFQPLHQIRTNQKYHHASAQVRTATKSGVMRGESRYILHPSTIKGIGQNWYYPRRERTSLRGTNLPSINLTLTPSPPRYNVIRTDIRLNSRPEKLALNTRPVNIFLIITSRSLNAL